MGTDLLQAATNERLDLNDFEFLASEGLQDLANEPFEAFVTNPLGVRSWVVEGFALTNVIADQLTATKGRAILASRENGVVKYGNLASWGDATKIVDLGATASGTYNVYVRFEYVDGDSESRIFWNPAGGGSEVTGTIPTRKNANWSMRVEAGSPGAEWLKVGEVIVSAGLTLSDHRNLYFEGSVPDTYESGWSSDGGGSANDRNADRQQYGVKDLQTFTAAMRQSLEDIKGRGLRRWWDRDIGGMNIGFDAAPVEDRIAVGDVNSYWGLEAGTTDPRLNFDSGNDYMLYDRSVDKWFFYVGGVEVFSFDEDRASVVYDLHVGNDLYFGAFGSNDYLAYNDSLKRYQFVLDGVSELQIIQDGLQVPNGLYVGGLGTPTDNDIYAVADIEAGNISEGRYGQFTSLARQTPTTAAEVVQRSAQNAVLARGKVIPLSGITGDHFNVSSINYPQGGVTGVTRVTLDVACDVNSSILVTAIPTTLDPTVAYNASAVWLTTTTFDVYISYMAGASPIGNGASFQFAIVGRPSATP